MEILTIIAAIFNVQIAAYVWYRVGRQNVFNDLLRDYRQQAKVVQIQELIIESYKRKYGELTDEDNKEN